MKPLLYTYRVLLTGIHLMRTGRVEANLQHLNEDSRLSHISELIARKIARAEASTLAETDLEFHRAQFERLTALQESASRESRLPEGPANRRELSDFLVRLRTTS